ncbi:MAG: hypothetical protein BWY26_01584 [Elusimicrobia bacterium ADurb.Bin231]|nr:MAG: hypothetical protein BWY26_01584 [Elusimicrobia bacterium ADurb.Bin231]
MLLKLTEENLELIENLAVTQTKKYGHDTGHFRLGRSESSHKIGFIGEIALIQYLRTLGFTAPKSGLCPMGARYDVFIKISEKEFKVHVKTGKWKTWPNVSSSFGVHWDQKIENSFAPVVLVSFTETSLPEVRIEGFVTPEYIGRCRIIEKGDIFPGQRYPSRCRNWLTYIMDFRRHPISGLIKYFENSRLWM